MLWMSSFFLFAAVVMMVAGFGLILDSGLHFLWAPRPRARSGRA